jgi:hypothetical protein
MKKVFLLFSAFAITVASFAQEVITSKKGYVVLPQAGDIALGFDAVPVINFALNASDIMSNDGGQAEHPSYVEGFENIIVGKYFTKDNTAIRVRFGINNTKITTKEYGDDLLSTQIDKPNILRETHKESNNKYFFAGGLEKRRGHNRLQGFYGGEALIGFNSNSRKGVYEVAFSAESVAAYQEFSRELSYKSGMAITFGLRGFAGVEYFVAPKISIGAEFGWGMGLTTTPRGKTETENWGQAPGSAAGTQPSAYVEETEGNSKSRSYQLNVDNGSNDALGTSGALSIHFHF